MKQGIRLPKITHKRLAVGLVLVLVGFALSVGVRAAMIKDTSVHYHANFALYINGQRDEFKSFAFYEEVAACSMHNESDPKPRTHMHGNNPGLVHVHDDAVTWGHFFANLGYGLGRESIETGTGAYVDGQDGKQLTFILNGQAVESPMNQVIRSEDRLLISYGTETEAQLDDQYKSVPSDAAQANTTADPAACAGAHELTWQSRIKQAIGFSAHE